MMDLDHSYDSETEEQSSFVPADSVKGTASLSELMHAGLDIPSPFMKDIFLVKQAIVGTRYQGGSDELVDDLKPGSRVMFIAEPDNRYDVNAVMALDSRGRKLGYIPRHENSIIGALLNAGKGIYGVISEDHPYSGTANRHTPYAIWVDLYMREFVLPEEMTQIPRQGYRGSYAVASFVFNEDTADDEDIGKRIESICAIKVINGEERDIFVGRTQGASREEQRKLTDSFRIFAGYLPIVGHDIEDRDIPVLEESYGVLLGIPFSNRVIDTKIMAENHLPGKYDYSLDALTDALGIEVHTDEEQERRCRKIWELYRRMECSELVKK